MRHNIRGVKLTPASRRRYKIGLPVEALSVNGLGTVCHRGVFRAGGFAPAPPEPDKLRKE